MYMSYCKFEGTYAELRTCLSDVEEHIIGEAPYAISDREITEFKDMVEYFYDFLCDNNLLDEDGDLDIDRLTEIGRTMSEACNDDDE